MWLARWELEADWEEQVQAARELRDEAKRVWDSHRELCEYFADWSRPIMHRHVYLMSQFKMIDG